MRSAGEAASKKRPREAEGHEAGTNGSAPAPAPAPSARPFRPVELPSPVTAAKAIKNASELEGMREAHLRDAVAVCQFLKWLEDKASGGSGSGQGRAGQ
ncbi:hypothetical protein GPECTOR_20g467 [Gonium pectorale]|uniref:Uncharacterized protein n=1 Tax=Gonium pectorale TaxID=33097 RepID=A0A150GIG5_GONPE|nr:hypothetical protein GPECTOR_20g467 [Gonium pectorale]|eukprot:KXZ49611.1 hypothetical protein GPECTOR_20g467 [Gonium pectorale]